MEKRLNEKTKNYIKLMDKIKKRNTSKNYFEKKSKFLQGNYPMNKGNFLFKKKLKYNLYNKYG